MTLPVEEWKGAAAVVLKQAADGHLAGQIYSPAGVAAKAKEQVLACLSLDVAAEEWPNVGKRDIVIGELQNKYRYLRPILFHSPYEAAAAFVIGHRGSIKQRRVIMRRMSEEVGEKTRIGEQASRP